MDEQCIVTPSKSEAKLFQFRRFQPILGSEFDIAVDRNTQQKLFFDKVRGTLSVDEKLRKRTSRSKKSALVGKVVRISEDEMNITIHIKAKGSNYDRSFSNYLKLETCSRNSNNCEFSMDKHSSPINLDEFPEFQENYEFLIELRD